MLEKVHRSCSLSNQLVSLSLSLVVHISPVHSLLGERFEFNHLAALLENSGVMRRCTLTSPLSMLELILVKMASVCEIHSNERTDF